MRVFDRICVDSFPRTSPFKPVIGSPALRVACVLYARQTQTGGTQTHALFNTDFGKVRANPWRMLGCSYSLGRSRFHGGRWEEVGSGRIGCSKSAGSLLGRAGRVNPTLTPRLESSDSREADILGSDLVSWTPARRCHLLHGDVFRNWCQSPTRNEFPLARRQEHYSNEPPSGGSIR